MRHHKIRIALLALTLPLAAFAATSTGAIASSNSLISAALKAIEAQSPQVARVSPERLAHAAINGILREIDPSGNSYSFSLREPRANPALPTPGFQVRIVEGAPTIAAVFPHTDAFYKDLTPGDILLDVGDTTAVGKTVAGIEDLLRGEAGSQAKLTVFRRKGKKFFEPSVKRETVQSQAFGRHVGRNIGWLAANVLDAKGVEQLRAKLEELLKTIKPIGLVLDLRSTTGGTIDDAVAAASLFVSGAPVVRIQGRGPTPIEKAAPQSVPATMPMVVICDLGTGGAAEVLAAALQDDKRAVVVGEKTIGQAAVQTTANLDPQNVIHFTSEVFLSPGGREIWAEGVKPDIAMKVEFPPQDKVLKFRQELTQFARGEKATARTTSTTSTESTTGTTATTSAEATPESTAEISEDDEDEEEEPGHDGKPKIKTTDGILEEYRLVKQYDTMLVRAINILISANIFFEYGQRSK